MKHSKQKNRVLKLIIGFFFLILVSFTIYKSSLLTQDKTNIIGTWVCDGDKDWKIKFDNNKKCYQYYTGDPAEVFNYKISSEKSPNGAEHTFVTLTTITSEVYETGDIIEYEINSLGEDKMTLEIHKPKTNYFHFTKE